MERAFAVVRGWDSLSLGAGFRRGADGTPSPSERVSPWRGRDSLSPGERAGVRAFCMENDNRLVVLFG